MATLLANVEATSLDTTPVAWADVLALTSGSVSVASTASVIILIATVPLLRGPDMFDDVAEFRFAVDGVREGPQITAFKDQVDELTSLTSLLWALTGISGSHTFSLQWQIVTGTPATDTTRTRNLQVIEIP